MSELAKWIDYARALDGARESVIVGTTLAHAPSVAELRELVAAKDYTLKQMAAAFVEFSPTWIAQDRATEDDWRKDFEALQARYATARTEAANAIASAKYKPLPDTEIGALVEWNGILRALKQVDGTVTRGDLQDLEARLETAGKRPDYSQVPQPSVKNDDELRLFQAADVAVRRLEATSSKLPWIALAVCGGIVLAKVMR